MACRLIRSHASTINKSHLNFKIQVAFFYSSSYVIMNECFVQFDEQLVVVLFEVETFFLRSLEYIH